MNFGQLDGLISIQWTKFVTTLMCLMSYMTVDMWEEGSKRSSQRSWKTSYLASGAKGKLEREREHYWTLMRQQQIQKQLENERQKCFSHDIIFVQTSDISIIKGQVTIILGIIDTLKPTSQLMVKMQSFKAKVTF